LMLGYAAYERGACFLVDQKKPSGEP